MSERRDQLLDAAIRLLADGGARVLTHRSIDEAAGVPAGSTSNLWRTRSTLIAAVLQRISELERERVAISGLKKSPTSAEDLVVAAADIVNRSLGPGRDLTLARQAIFHEAASDPAVSHLLNDATEIWWTILGGWLTNLQVHDAARRARWLLAYLDGLIADQLSRPLNSFDASEAVYPAVFGMLHA